MTDSSVRWMYLLGILQFFAMTAVVLTYPAMQTVVFIVKPEEKFNITAPVGKVQPANIDLGLPLVLISLAVLVFVTVTVRMLSETVLDSMSFTEDNISSAIHWDTLFWFMVTAVHAIFVSAVCSPVDLFACLVATYTIVKALNQICKPLSDDPNMMKVNISIVGFVIGMGVALYCTPTRYPSRYITFCILAILDYILVVGHTWDRNPSVQTVANCRLCWSISAALFITGLYGNFHDRWLMM